MSIVRVTGSTVAPSIASATSAPGLAWDTSPSASTVPRNTSPPSISGTPTVGQTLTSSAGSWTDLGGAPVTGQWLADGLEIAGETGATLLLGAELEGAIIGYRETAGQIAAVSNTLGPVAGA